MMEQARQMEIPAEAEILQDKELSLDGFREMGFPLAESDDGEDLDNFEMVNPEFFSQPKEPAFTVNVRTISANAACVRMLPDVDHVKIMINQDELKLLLKPCDELDMYGYKWARMKDGRRYASQRTGLPFVLMLCQFMGWNPDDRHKIRGKKTRAKGEEVMVFDLTRAQHFEKPAPGEDAKAARRVAMPANWNGSFGPKYGQDKRSLHLNTFSGYTVFSIKEKGGLNKQSGIDDQKVTAGDEAENTAEETL